MAVCPTQYLKGDITMENVLAPIPGKVVEITVKPGQSVSEGEIVLILEAMKMENEIYADSDGVVEEIKVKEGDKVAANDVLMVIK